MTLRPLVCLSLALCSAAATAAEPVYRWEAGAALASYSYADWRGASHRNTTFLPLPYVVYRGDRVKLARDGLKVRLLDSEHLSLNFAAAFSLVGDAAKNPARAGMSKLLNTFSAGPVLNARLIDGPTQLDLRLPVYVVGATNFKRFQSAGLTSFPHLRLRNESQHGPYTLRVGGSLGVELANEQYHDYFYQVRPSEARTNRPAYDANAGYGGTSLSSYAAASRGPWGYGVYLKLESLQGAAFADSPLVQTKSVLSGGLGLSYRFLQRGPVASDSDE